MHDTHRTTTKELQISPSYSSYVSAEHAERGALCAASNPRTKQPFHHACCGQVSWQAVDSITPISGFRASSSITLMLRLSSRLDQKHGSQAMLLVVEVLLASNSPFVAMSTPEGGCSI